MNPNTLKLNWTTCKYHQNQKNENIPYLRPSLHLHSWSFPVQLPDKLNKVLSTLNLLQYWTNLLSWEKVCAVLYIPYLLLVWWLIHWLLIQAWQPTKQWFQVNYHIIAKQETINRWVLYTHSYTSCSLKYCIMETIAVKYYNFLWCCFKALFFPVSVFLSPVKELNLTCCEATEANWAALEANELQPYKQQQCSLEGFVKYKYYESNK